MRRDCRGSARRRAEADESGVRRGSLVTGEMVMPADHADAIKVPGRE